MCKQNGKQSKASVLKCNWDNHDVLKKEERYVQQQHYIFQQIFNRLCSKLLDSTHLFVDPPEQKITVFFFKSSVFVSLSAGDGVVPGGSETSSHRARIISWLSWRRARWHQRRPDWDPFAALGGKAQRAHWHQEASPAVWESQEGHVGELHFAQVVKMCCFCLKSFNVDFFSPFLLHKTV